MNANNRVLLILAALAIIGLAVSAVYICTVGWRDGVQIIPGLLTFVTTLLLVGVTWQYTKHTGKMADTMARQTGGDLLLRLNELYAQPATRKAIGFIHQVKCEWWVDFPENRYHFGERFCKRCASDSEGNQLRWHLVNFWYTLAVLVEEKIVTGETVYRRFGPPEVIEILEPIEAVRAYDLSLKDDPNVDPESFKRDWPPLKLFASWASTKVGKEWDHRKPQQEQLPAFPHEFKDWADVCRKPKEQ